MKISLWDSKTLLVLLAAGQGASLVYASVALDGHADPALLTAVAIIRGVLVGIGASFAASYSSYQLPRVKHKVASRIGWWSLACLIVCSILVVGISSVGTPQDWLRWVVSIGYSVLTDSAVVAVAMAGGKLFSEEKAETTTPQPSKPVVTPVVGRIDGVVLDSKLKANPKTTNAALAQLFGVSPQAISKHRREKEAVRIPGKDGGA